MHFKNARNASVYAVFMAFFTQSLAKLRILNISHSDSFRLHRVLLFLHSATFFATTTNLPSVS